MTLDRRDPEYQQQLADKQWRLDQAWLRGYIGDATLLRSLMIDGLLPDEARTRLSLLQTVKNEAR